MLTILANIQVKKLLIYLFNDLLMNEIWSFFWHVVRNEYEQEDLFLFFGVFFVAVVVAM